MSRQLLRLTGLVLCFALGAAPLASTARAAEPSCIADGPLVPGVFHHVVYNVRTGEIHWGILNPKLFNPQRRGGHLALLSQVQGVNDVHKLRQIGDWAGLGFIPGKDAKSIHLHRLMSFKAMGMVRMPFGQRPHLLNNRLPKTEFWGLLHKDYHVGALSALAEKTGLPLVLDPDTALDESKLFTFNPANNAELWWNRNDINGRITKDLPQTIDVINERVASLSVGAGSLDTTDYSQIFIRGPMVRDPNPFRIRVAPSGGAFVPEQFAPAGSAMGAMGAAEAVPGALLDGAALEAAAGMVGSGLFIGNEMGGFDGVNYLLGRDYYPIHEEEKAGGKAMLYDLFGRMPWDPVHPETQRALDAFPQATKMGKRREWANGGPDPWFYRRWWGHGLDFWHDLTGR